MEANVAVPLSRSLLRIAIGSAVGLSTAVAMADTAEAASASKWDRLAVCESGGNWSINSGNGYSGGLQVSLPTWRAFGGKDAPHRASRTEQINVAERILRAQGWRAWPACSQKLGLR
jgi:hypothetical protein